MQLKQVLSEIIAIDSTSHLSNDPFVKYVEQFLEGKGVVCHRLPSHETGKYDLLLVKGEPSESGLTLCGHMDTVPANLEQWQNNPWDLTERDGNWYARGSCDMKGFIAIALHAIVQADVQHGCLAVLLLCDEELGSFGAKHVLQHGLPVAIPKQVIIGEPTSLQTVRLHKGHLSMKVTIHGVSAHTGSPQLGKNAAIEGGNVICAIAALSKKYEAVCTQTSELFSEEARFPVLTVATVHSGNAINVVPETCELGIGLRLLPDQEKDSAVAELKEAIAQVCDLPWTFEELGDNPTMLTPERAPINQWLCSHIGQEDSVGVSFGTDGGYLARAGYECVLYGAGDIAVAHKPDEHVPINEMEICVETINAAIQHFCGTQT